uniref:Uncharacterized protein n=1 Tax=Nelumbo nucifera TaxID=4432 RepID=A0A822YNV9_NELNU|nr:TPA_asm: hypothetical protein HUJ06_009809 [Nelumbo nucifera]
MEKKREKVSLLKRTSQFTHSQKRKKHDEIIHSNRVLNFHSSIGTLHAYFPWKSIAISLGVLTQG